MAIFARILVGAFKPFNAGFFSYERRAYSIDSNNSIFSIFRKIFSFKTSGTPSPDKASRMIVLSEKELKELCDRNFERQLNEIDERARKTAANTLKGSAKD